MGRAAVVVCLAATLSASWPLSEPPLRPGDDPPWIAVVEGRGNLYPIARLDEGGIRVVEIDGEVGRVLSRTHAGGC